MFETPTSWKRKSAMSNVVDWTSTAWSILQGLKIINVLCCGCRILLCMVSSGPWFSSTLTTPYSDFLKVPNNFLPEWEASEIEEIEGWEIEASESLKRSYPQFTSSTIQTKPNLVVLHSLFLSSLKFEFQFYFKGV